MSDKATHQIIRLNLSANQIAVIYHLIRKGKTRITDVAKEIGLTSAAMTGLADKLLEKKLISKSEGKLANGKPDRRVKMLCLTQKGNDLAQKL